MAIEQTSLEAQLLLAQCVRQKCELELMLTRICPHPSGSSVWGVVARSDIRDKLVAIAAEARPLARSYRNFDVACACIALRPSATSPHPIWYVRFDANTKRFANDQKYCSEQRTFDAVLAKRGAIFCMAVVGHPQPDHGSGRHNTEALEPCEMCRLRMMGLMLAKQPIISRHTGIVCANADDTSRRTVHTVQSLLEAHGERFSHEKGR